MGSERAAQLMDRNMETTWEEELGLQVVGAWTGNTSWVRHCLLS